MIVHDFLKMMLISNGFIISVWISMIYIDFTWFYMIVTWLQMISQNSFQMISYDFVWCSRMSLDFEWFLRVVYGCLKISHDLKLFITVVYDFTKKYNDVIWVRKSCVMVVYDLVWFLMISYCVSQVNIISHDFTQFHMIGFMISLQLCCFPVIL